MLKRVALLALLLSLAGCGFFTDEDITPDDPGTTNPARFAYVANYTGGALSGFTVNASNGRLTPMSPGSFAGVGAPVALRVNADGTLLFAADQVLGAVSFPIDRNTGALGNPIGAAAAGSAPFAMAYNGTYLYIANRGSDNVSGYSVSSTGTIAALTGFPVATGNNPNGMRADRSGRLLYVATDAGTNVFTIGSSGSLTSTRLVPPESGTVALDVAVDSNSRFAFVANGSTGVEAYAVNGNTGDLTRIAASPFAAGSEPAALTVTPDGRYLYVVNRASNDVTGFTINGDGTLTAISGSPWSAGTRPVAITVDQSGQFVYVANRDSNNVSMYLIGSNGALQSQGTAENLAAPVAVITTR